MLQVGHLEQTGLMFIGLPLMLAIGLSLTPRPQSATGVIMKGIALALLLSGILLIEGFICILMAAPLFFLVGFIVGWLVDRSRKKDEDVYRSRFNCSLLVVIGLMSLEGVTEWLSFDRSEVVEVVEVIQMSSDDIRLKLAQGPEFDLEELPVFLQLGFPAPASIEGGGLEVGDRWSIHMAGGEGEAGDLVVEVVKNDGGGIRFECVSDRSHIAHWMSWKSVEWKIEVLDDDLCKVTMVMEYDRLLDPAWYFKPIERYGVAKAGGYFMSQTFKEN